MEKSQHSAAYKRLVEVLKSAREAGLTQEQVTERLKAYPTFFSKVETLERRIDVVELIQICKVLRVDPIEIMREAKLIKLECAWWGLTVSENGDLDPPRRGDSARCHRH
jgi:transcriptional regulator with XRE-family HTH domain